MVIANQFEIMQAAIVMPSADNSPAHHTQTRGGLRSHSAAAARIVNVGLPLDRTDYRMMREHDLARGREKRATASDHRNVDHANENFHRRSMWPYNDCGMHIANHRCQRFHVEENAPRESLLAPGLRIG
jgi:hypothetical protein